jgi:hypothetical protein
MVGLSMKMCTRVDLEGTGVGNFRSIMFSIMQGRGLFTEFASWQKSYFRLVRE